MVELIPIKAKSINSATYSELPIFQTYEEPCRLHSMAPCAGQARARSIPHGSSGTASGAWGQSSLKSSTVDCNNGPIPAKGQKFEHN